MTSEDRINHLCALLVEAICALPPDKRLPELRDIITVLPVVFRRTEETMRRALVANARAGL